MPPPSIRENFEIGEAVTLSRTITEVAIALTAEATGDDNPLHLDEAYAKTTRFQGRIAHGVLCAGMFSAILGTKLPGPGGIYLSQTLQFHLPVRLGDVITAEARVTKWRTDKRILTLATRCTNQRGEEVVGGEAVMMVEAPAS